MDDLSCFVGQKALIERGNTVLILHDPEMGLDLPGGKIQEGEEGDISRALQREVEEETGLTISVQEPFATWFFTIPHGLHHRSAGKKIFTIAYRCSYVSGFIQLSAEHDWYKWVGKEEYTRYLGTSNFDVVLQKYFSR